MPSSLQYPLERDREVQRRWGRLLRVTTTMSANRQSSESRMKTIRFPEERFGPSQKDVRLERIANGRPYVGYVIGIVALMVVVVAPGLPQCQPTPHCNRHLRSRVWATGTRVPVRCFPRSQKYLPVLGA